MGTIKVRQFEVKNQFLIEDNNVLYLQSYDVIVACWNYEDKKLILFEKWDYSKTTLKYVYRFIKYYSTNDLCHDFMEAKNKHDFITTCLYDTHRIIRGF